MQPTEIIQKLQAFIPDIDLVRTDETNEKGGHYPLVIIESQHLSNGALRWQLSSSPRVRQHSINKARGRLELLDEEAATLLGLFAELHSKAPFAAWPRRIVKPSHNPLPDQLKPQLQSLLECLQSVPNLEEVWLVSDTPPQNLGQTRRPGVDNKRWWVQFQMQPGNTISLQWATALTTLKMRVRGEDQPHANKRWEAWSKALGTSPDRLDQLAIRLLPFMMLAAPCRVRRMSHG